MGISELSRTCLPPSLSFLFLNCGAVAISTARVKDWLLTLAICAVTFRELARLLSGLLQCHVILKQHQRKATLCKSQNMGILAEPRCHVHMQRHKNASMSKRFSLIRVTVTMAWIYVQLWGSFCISCQSVGSTGVQLGKPAKIPLCESGRAISQFVKG